MKQLTFIFGFLLLLMACSKEDVRIVNEPLLPNTPYSYDGGNDMATLGRVLFYDKNLSINKSVSCGSCHKQQFAFADNKAFSPGVNVTKTLRNSMALSNLDNSGAFFWDQRESNLENLVFGPITNHIEMGIKDVDALVENINSIHYYKPLFENSFGSPQVTDEKIEEAIAAFLRSLDSRASKFDLEQDGVVNFTFQEDLGRQLFMGRAQCSNCHMGSNLGGSLNANIGLEMNYADKGIGEFYNQPEQYGEFKTPSLRNIELTAPYMHDGRFQTLEEVVSHYNGGIQAHPNLNWRLTEDALDLDPFGWWVEPENGGTPINLNLSNSDQKALIAFLKTLTDQDFCTDIRYSDPFRK